MWKMADMLIWQIGIMAVQKTDVKSKEVPHVTCGISNF